MPLLFDVILGLKICLLLTDAQLAWLQTHLDVFLMFKEFQTGTYHCRCGDDGCFCCNPTFLQLLDLISDYINKKIGNQALLENYEQRRMRWNPFFKDIPINTENTDILIEGLMTCNLLSTAQFFWLRNNRNDFYESFDIIKLNYRCKNCTKLCFCFCPEHNDEVREQIPYHIDTEIADAVPVAIPVAVQVAVPVNDEGFSE